MSLKKYKMVDILVFVVLAIIFELANYFATSKIENFKLIFMSYTIVLSLICIFRWGLFGSIVSLAGGITACIVSGASNIEQFVAYGVGNLFVIIPALIFQYGIGREALKKNKILMLLYLITDFVFVISARCLIISLFHFDSFLDTFVQSIQSEIIMESMSLVISVIILLVACRKKGQLMVEMVSYIKDVQDHMKLGGLKEYQESPNFNFDKPYTEEGQFDNGNLLDGGTLSKQQLKELDEMCKKDTKDMKINLNTSEEHDGKVSK